eukprot:scaffold116532_cov75-Phaeocystis_antarctica.AAC.2
MVAHGVCLDVLARGCVRRYLRGRRLDVPVPIRLPQAWRASSTVGAQPHEAALDVLLGCRLLLAQLVRQDRAEVVVQEHCARGIGAARSKHRLCKSHKRGARPFATVVDDSHRRRPSRRWWLTRQGCPRRTVARIFQQAAQ